MESKLSLCVLSFLLFVGACEGPAGQNDDPDPILEKITINGNVQKGPFLNGTSVTLFELDNELSQTGRSFNTQITDNSGTFTMNQVPLQSEFVELMANGFYYNEVDGENSGAQLTLYGVARLTDTARVNINLMTHLERNRIYTLIDKGLEFDEARKQAQEELMQLFYIGLSSARSSEFLDIAKSSDDNAALLTISVILQGFRSDSDFSELMAEIIQDFSPDGSLDNEATIQAIINHATLLDTGQIRTNLETRYANLGIPAEIPAFEVNLQTFLDSTGVEPSERIVYPSSGSFGVNILNSELNQVIAMEKYSMTAEMAYNMTVKIRLSNGKWAYKTSPPPQNWSATDYDHQEKVQTFTSSEPGEDCELEMIFFPPVSEYDPGKDSTYMINDTITIEYFENDASTPNQVRKIVVVEE